MEFLKSLSGKVSEGWPGFALIALLLQQPDFEPLYRQALEQREQALGKDAAKTRESARDLALVSGGAGRVCQGGALHGAGAGDGRHARRRRRCCTIGRWRWRRRDAAEAERMYRKALAIREKTLPAADVELATTRLNLAGAGARRGTRARR